MVTKGNVLVVDDEINLCRILGAKLAKSGYSVVAVHDGLQAVEKVRESDFDVVLLDLILPKMDGLTALAKIRGMRSTIPVIVMTACENAEAFAQAKSYGASACINKPFDLDNLVSLVSDTSVLRDSGLAKRLPNSTILFCKDQPITLELQNGAPAKPYCGWILSKDDRTLSVAVPRREDEIGQIALRCTAKVGLASVDAFYSFTTTVLRAVESPDRLLVLDKPGVIYRTQRRQYSRLGLRMPVAYAAHTEGDEELQHRSGKSLDVSLGGVCLAVSEDIPAGEILNVELLSNAVEDKINAVAHVLRSRRSDDPAQGDYILGCRFVSADDSLKKLLDC